MKLQEKRKVRETDEEEKETDRKQEPQAKGGEKRVLMVEGTEKGRKPAGRKARSGRE